MPHSRGAVRGLNKFRNICRTKGLRPDAPRPLKRTEQAMGILTARSPESLWAGEDTSDFEDEDMDDAYDQGVSPAHEALPDPIPGDDNEDEDEDLDDPELEEVFDFGYASSSSGGEDDVEEAGVVPGCIGMDSLMEAEASRDETDEDTERPAPF
ncbi:hypothetical protein C8Q77DRAFT_1272821 [Trametes polyzona]|nr:hypothetical protein C8Q77DRAFT_1272821 [Trametes polyzona]